MQTLVNTAEFNISKNNTHAHIYLSIYDRGQRRRTKPFLGAAWEWSEEKASILILLCTPERLESYKRNVFLYHFCN